MGNKWRGEREGNCGYMGVEDEYDKRPRREALEMMWPESKTDLGMFVSLYCQHRRKSALTSNPFYVQDCDVSYNAG